MTARLWLVTVESTLYVVADSEAAAERVARWHLHDEEPRTVYADEVDEARPDDRASLPWRDHGIDRGTWTVGDWIDAQIAQEVSRG